MKKKVNYNEELSPNFSKILKFKFSELLTIKFLFFFVKSYLFLSKSMSEPPASLTKRIPGI